MKKMIAFLMLAVCAVSAFAVVDNEPFSVQVIGTTTNTRSIVVRGELDAIKVDVTAGQTCDVSVATAEMTLLSLSDVVTDATYLPRAALHTTAGAAATFNAYSGTYAVTTTTNEIYTYSGVSNDVPTTNSVLTYKVVPTDAAAAQTLYGKMPMAGSVTVTVIGKSAGTNSVVATLLYTR